MSLYSIYIHSACALSSHKCVVAMQPVISACICGLNTTFSMHILFHVSAF
jgi:hypothetical protein